MGYIKTPDVIVYHGNCQDGFTGAWVAWKKFGDYPQYRPGVHGKVLPPEVFINKDVLFIDFTYKKNVMMAIAEVAKSIVILDHHKTAEADLSGFTPFTVGDEASFDAAWERSLNDDTDRNDPGIVVAGFDMNRSGAMLAWDFLFPGVVSPLMVNYVQDRDLWRKELSNTDDICMWLFSFDYTFENWEDARDAIAASSTRAQVIVAGQAVQRKLMKDIEELLPLTTRLMTLRGHRVPIANLPYTMASEGANLLAAGQKFGATYWVDSDGYAQFSLRSIGEFDVSTVATTFGGGGHRNAAGFKVPLIDFPEIWQPKASTGNEY